MEKVEFSKKPCPCTGVGCQPEDKEKINNLDWTSERQYLAKLWADKNCPMCNESGLIIIKEGTCRTQKTVKKDPETNK